MKKIILFLLLFLTSPNIICADTNKRIEVKLEKCVDGDTAHFLVENETIKTRFLAIDTPESTNEIEEYGKQASEFTCNKLKNSKKIEIEYDENSDKLDKYDRHLVWVFVDNQLLQNLIIKEGLAKVEYLYDDYKYTETLIASEEIAKSEKINIWNEHKEKNNDYFFLVIIAIIIITLAILSKRYRKKIANKIKSKIKNKLKKEIEKQLN